MKIGLTYDLRSEYLALGYGEEETAELDREDTIDALDSTIRALGHDVVRIGHAKSLIERLAKGERWDLVFNIAEGIFGEARESQVPAILDVHRIPYTFSDPLVLAVCLDKGLAKLVLEKAGVPTAPFAVVRHPNDPVKLEPPLFAKPIAEGTSKGIGPKSKIERMCDLPEVCADLIARFSQPVLVEEYLPGRELTVGIVGTGSRAEVIGALEVKLLSGAEQGVYSYTNKKDWEGRVEYALVPSGDAEGQRAMRVALDAWRALGCRDGGRVDVRMDRRGQPAFIEANPLAGLNPEISDLAILCRKAGWTYRDLISRILESAIERMP